MDPCAATTLLSLCSRSKRKMPPYQLSSFRCPFVDIHGPPILHTSSLLLLWQRLLPRRLYIYAAVALAHPVCGITTGSFLGGFLAGRHINRHVLLTAGPVIHALGHLTSRKGHSSGLPPNRLSVKDTDSFRCCSLQSFGW